MRDLTNNIKAAWFAAFEDAVVKIDNQHRGRINWDAATFHFNQGSTPLEAATIYAKPTNT